MRGETSTERHIAFGPPRPDKTVIRLAGALAGIVGLLATMAAPAQADVASDEARLLQLTNQTRAAAGSAPLTLDPALSVIARTWAGVMAAAGGISHNPNLGSLVPGNWTKVGENVGMGGTVDHIHHMILGSPAHYKNEVDPSFNRVGIGIVHSGNAVWMVQNFVQIGAVAAPAPAPEPAPAPVPRATATTAAPTTVAPPTTSTTTLPPPPPPPPLAMQLALMVGQLRVLGAS